jgi:hypothetical protein
MFYKIFSIISILVLFNSAAFSQNNNFTGDGLKGYYYQGYFKDSSGVIICDSLTLDHSQVDTMIDFWNGNRYYSYNPVPGWTNNYSVEWKGFIFIETTGQYGFGTISDDGSQIFIDSNLVVDNGELQWYDWEDNISEGDTSNTPFPPLILDSGFHEISVLFYENASYDGIELWWLKPGADTSDIPYYGTNFHGIPPTYNDSTNWELVPKQVLFTNIDSLVLIENPNNGYQLPKEIRVSQNYPNPFNNSTIFEFELPGNGNLRFEIFDITGKKVYEQNIGSVTAATRKIHWNGLSNNGTEVSSGIYFYRFLFIGKNGIKNIQIKKLMLLR